MWANVKLVPEKLNVQSRAMTLSQENTEVIKYEGRSEEVGRNKVAWESWKKAKRETRVRDKSMRP